MTHTGPPAPLAPTDMGAGHDRFQREERPLQVAENAPILKRPLLVGSRQLR
jgi:hypothetical protein